MPFPTPPRWPVLTRYPVPALPTWNAIPPGSTAGPDDPRSPSSKLSCAQSFCRRADKIGPARAHGRMRLVAGHPVGSG
jgi:hypothetical protein